MCVFIPATVLSLSAVEALQSVVQQEVYREVSIDIMGWSEVGDGACRDSQAAQDCVDNTHQNDTITPMFPFFPSFPF